MELRSGYKQTEVGILPEDWEVRSFEKLFSFKNGVNADRSSYGRGVPFVNVLEPISYSHIYGHEVTGRITLPRSVIASYALRLGDILFNRTSETDLELGLAAAFLGEEEIVFGGFVIRGRPNDSRLDPLYAGYALRAPVIRRQIIPMGQGAVRANIGQQNLGRVLVPLPSPPEQRAIAEALSDVDDQLGALDRFITKKRDLKQAAMQQLLTGQTRLPGFHGEWGLKRLGNAAEIVSGGTPRTTEPSYWNGGIKWCTPTDITGFSGKFLVETERTISQDGLRDSGARILPAGALLLCSRATIGEVKIAGCEICTNQGFKSLICRPGISNEFLYYKLLTMKPQMVERSFGSTFLEISTRNVASLELSLPDFSEQAAIATVLSDMDAELTALEARHTKTVALKQGMMQELLTGRTRLVKPEVAHA
jgi:type I restriction enzyme S subunit